MQSTNKLREANLEQMWENRIRKVYVRNYIELNPCVHPGSHLIVGQEGERGGTDPGLSHRLQPPVQRLRPKSATMQAPHRHFIF